MNNHLALDFRNDYFSLEASEKESLISDELNSSVRIYGLTFDDLSDPEKKVVQNYKFKTTDHVEVADSAIFISPLFGFGLNQNPFKDENRLLPIEFNTPWENKTILNISIPNGYKAETLPEAINIGIPEEMGSYKYSCKEIGGSVQILSVINITATNISPEYYDAIRDFYRIIIKKESEKIIVSKL